MFSFLSQQNLDTETTTILAEKYLRQKRTYVVGKEGSYGVAWSPSSYASKGYLIEGIIENGRINKFSTLGPVIIHDSTGEVTSIKGKYTKEISPLYNGEQIYIQVYQNTDRKVKLIDYIYKQNEKSIRNYKNGEYVDQNSEKGSYNLKQIMEQEANLARKNLKDFNNDSLIKAITILNKALSIAKDFELNEFNKNISKWNSKSDFKNEDCSLLIDDYKTAMKYKKIKEATMLITKHFQCDGPGFEGSNYYLLGYHYREIKQYNTAIQNLKKWEGLISAENLSDLKSCYSMLADCYSGLKDTKNSSLYKSKSEALQNKLKPVQTNEDKDISVDWRVYCYTTIQGTYKLKLNDKTKEVQYKLYRNGTAIKVLNGNWILRDEGAYILTVNWTGENSSLPAMKFVTQYDGYGNLQGLIDNQNRQWDKCEK